MILLSPHFTLAEFVASDIAARKGIDNTPPPQVVEELKRTAALMEQIRTLLNFPITITSGYRCSALNKLCSSKPTSKHVQGLACDFRCPQYGDPVKVCEAIAKSDLVWGKLILEFYESAANPGWIHIQIGSEKKVLTINRHGIFAGIHP